MSAKKTYQLRFEYYVPSVAWVEVEAESLAQAIVQAASIDAEDDLGFQCDFNCSTSSRLVCVVDEHDQTVAEFSDEYWKGSAAWMEADLRDQWTADAPVSAEGVDA